MAAAVADSILYPIAYTLMKIFIELRRHSCIKNCFNTPASKVSNANTYSAGLGPKYKILNEIYFKIIQKFIKD